MYRENLIKGYGQTLRVGIRQGTFWSHARRMKRYLQFQLFLVIGVLSLGAGALFGDWRFAAAWGAMVLASVCLFMMRSRSLTKPFQLIADWAVWTPPMVVGFLERPRDPRTIQPAALIARESDRRRA